MFGQLPQVGDTYSMVTITSIREAEPDGPYGTRYTGMCRCGTETMFQNKIRVGLSVSCGCEDFLIPPAKPLSSHYALWHDMIKKCYNPSHPEYAEYGGKGIQVSDDWRMYFNTFDQDLKLLPIFCYGMKRIDKSKEFSFSNVVVTPIDGEPDATRPVTIETVYKTIDSLTTEISSLEWRMRRIVIEEHLGVMHARQHLVALKYLALNKLKTLKDKRRTEPTQGN